MDLVEQPMYQIYRAFRTFTFFISSPFTASISISVFNPANSFVCSIESGQRRAQCIERIKGEFSAI